MKYEAASPLPMDYESLRIAQVKKSCYFDDLVRKIDYVLVVDEALLKNKDTNLKIHMFLNGLTDRGVELEITSGIAFRNYIFVKLHGPLDILSHLASVFHVEVSYNNPNHEGDHKSPFKFLNHELINPHHNSILHGRVSSSTLGERPTNFTNCERSMLIHKLLNIIPYGDVEFGVQNMTDGKLLVASYPLHDGPYQWTKVGPLSDRQILARYWASYTMVLKKQPLALIEKYFGPEVALYFGWLEFYVKMLVPAAIVGIISFVAGTVQTMWVENYVFESEICNSDLPICPDCSHYTLCPFQQLKDQCNYIKVGFMLDNALSIFFSIFMSIWATVFLALWRRRENHFKLRWNLFSVEKDETARQEYLLKAKHEKVSSVTGTIELYIPRKYKCLKVTLSTATGIFFGMLVVAVAASVIIYRFNMTYIAYVSPDHRVKRNASLIASVTGSLFIVMSIMVFTIIYEYIALVLTQIECPRTQREFDNSFVYKNCCLNFANSYSAIVYIAFFKGKFFTYPGDTHQWYILGGIAADSCGAGGCLTDVGIQMSISLVIAASFSSLFQLLTPLIDVKLKRNFYRLYSNELPQWEQDFVLDTTYRYYLFKEYREMVTQYGFITCFVAACPLAPFFALVKNIIEIRIDSRKLLKYSKRQVAVKMEGLGAYKGLLVWMTYASVITNGCVIAFSSNFIPRLIYRLQNNFSMSGFINSTLSKFNVRDYEVVPKKSAAPNITVCYYEGLRNGPDHPRKYKLSSQYYYQLAMEFAFVFVFEHLLLLIKAILAFMIPAVPRFVRQKLDFQEKQIKAAKITILNDLYAKHHPKKHDSVSLSAKTTS